MAKKNKKLEKSFIGEDLRIGKRPDSSMFWLRTENSESAKDKNLPVVEGGNAWVDKESDTIILSFPTKDPKILSNLESEFYGQEGFWQSHTGSEYYVHLSECKLHEPTLTSEYGPFGNDSYYKDSSLENTGFVLNENTFVRKDEELGTLCYVQYSEFTQEDYHQDRFGWIEALKRLIPDENEDDLQERIQSSFIWKSYGDVWIDEDHGVLVLGPVVKRPPDNFDEYQCEYLEKLINSLPIWDQTKFWIETESRLKRTPVNRQMAYWRLCLRFCDY